VTSLTLHTETPAPDDATRARTLVGDLAPREGTPGYGAWARRRRTLRSEGGRISVSRPYSAAFVAGHDAPLIGERAATRGSPRRKVAMSAPVWKRALSVRSSLANRIARREPRAVGGRSTD
jgi:hypothetical protein